MIPMQQITLAQASQQLSELIEAAINGEEIIMHLMLMQLQEYGNCFYFCSQ
jgi:hypothetical protein